MVEGGCVAAHVSGVFLFLVHELVRWVESHEQQILVEALVLHPRLGILSVLCEGEEVVCEDMRVHEDGRLDLRVGSQQLDLVEESGTQSIRLSCLCERVP